jgi:hypothetical protein
MSLDDLKPFDPHEKVIEYLMVDPAEQARREKLVRMSLKDFAAETASESPARAVAQSLPTWALSVPLWEPWSQTCQLTRGAGTIDGKSFQTGLKKVRQLCSSGCARGRGHCRLRQDNGCFRAA